VQKADVQGNEMRKNMSNEGIRPNKYKIKTVNESKVHPITCHEGTGGGE
jgi:hypothetical protein